MISAALESGSTQSSQGLDNVKEYSFEFHFVDTLKQSLGYLAQVPFTAFINAQDCACRILTKEEVFEAINELINRESNTFQIWLKPVNLQAKQRQQ